MFIASSAGMFGQPLEAHYAAAKAGLVGLTNVIAIEGAPHGILANTVLPFGFSRMVTETVGDPKFLEESGFLRRDPAGTRRADRGVPRQPRLRLQPSQLLGRAPAASRGCSSASAEGWLARTAAASPTADDIAAHIDEVSATEPFTVPEVDLRRGLRGQRAACREPSPRPQQVRLPARRDASDGPAATPTVLDSV